ncbi:hypothetical protein TARUN_4705 [Trichoderma arundinaceum]|uniref:Galactose oxidase kelch beta-propeller n=1 Tax=Trichoderma arundinaceum TaxID=490622 RepID=A0A395NNG8_TRIAR|nr:hypothetical protein TARUN_4705 [Trichoderma arundinaceum]
MAVLPEVFGRGRAQPHRATPGLAPPSRLVWAAALLLGAPLAAAAHSFPYVPTQILTPDACFNQSACHGPDVAYIFTQDSSDEVLFLSLNISNVVGPDVQLDAVTPSLPFLGGANPENTAFGAVRTKEGAVLVYAGECDQGPGNVWTYGEGAASGGSGSTAWLKQATTSGKSQKSTSSRGPYFLGGTIAFSATLAPLLDEPTIYSYGGMCATPSDNSTGWQADANYTTSMMTLIPADNSPSSRSYAQGTASGSGPKTPIAGFSLTALPSSMSNNSGTVTQQASYVVIGGHTRQAFINMSTAAVWNLPEESWSYVNVQQPADNEDGIDSRSGHTAILSADGSSIVVLGGWVGDVTNAAVPQLAVLEMSQAYSSWRWTIPKQQPDFGDTGIYGHGAAILPGNVMMVYGGWQIGDSDSSSKVKRQSGVTLSPQFLNLTDMSWSTSYSNPTAVEGAGTSPNSTPGTAANSTKARTLGLGLGFGIGGGAAAFILGIIGFFCWRKRQRRRAAREETIRAMAQDASMFIHDTSDMAERTDSFPWGYRSWYTGGQDPYQSAANDRSVGYESLRGSYGGYAPVVPGVARKPVSRQLRGGYVPANAQQGSFMSTPGQIHPIMEDEEEDLAYQRVHPNEVTTPTSEAYSDPFLTPTAAVAAGGMSVFQPPPPGQSTAGPSTDGPFQHDPDVQDWVSDVDAADAMLARYNSTRQAQGRGSPTRRNSQRSSGMREDERTESGLSESNRSAADGLGRSSSGRWSAIVASAFGGASAATTEPGKPGSSSSSSYNTAKSGFGALQAEGPNLLMGRSTPSSPFDDDDMQQPSSPSKSKPRRNWLGSLRRVFSGSESTSGDLSARDRSPTREISTDMLSHDYEPPLSALSSELLRRKQGRQDWEGGASGAAAERENEWDIERAVENRLVQVMFTVPKERLRVVNADDLDDGTSTDERQPLHLPQTAELVDMDRRSSRIDPSLRSVSKLSSHHDDEGGGVPVDEGDRDDGFLRINQDDYDERSEKSERPLSIATDVSFARSASVYTAEAMTFERPKTRVLQMVDRIESQGSSPSQDTSPSVSRAGTPGIRSIKSKKSLRSEDLKRH